MTISDNDRIVLEYIGNSSGYFTNEDIDKWSEDISSNELCIVQNLAYECADYDYDFENGYVQIQVSQITKIINF